MSCCEQREFPLTVGIAVYDGFDAAALTLQSLRLHSGLSPDELQLVVVDNHPANGQLMALCMQIGATYHTFTEIVGTSAPRDEIFRVSTGRTVCVLDSHVLLAPNSLRRLLDYSDAYANSKDLWHGPMFYDALNPKDAATHMKPEWGDTLMFGTWATDERGTHEHAEPFEIPMHGLGLFACRREAWVGFPPGLRGFGGEEGMIHEAFRQAGGKVLCLPFLRWWHLFRNTNAAPPFPVSMLDRLRNYLIWADHLNMSRDEIVDRFRGHLPDDHIRLAIDTSALPPGHVRAANYAKAVVTDIATGRRRMPDHAYEKRVAACMTCDYRLGDDCAICGCPVHEKARWASERCPHPDGSRWKNAMQIDAPEHEQEPTKPSCSHQSFNAAVRVEATADRSNMFASLTVRCELCGQFCTFPDGQNEPEVTVRVEAPAIRLESSAPAM